MPESQKCSQCFISLFLSSPGLLSFTSTEGNFYHLKDLCADIGMRVGLNAMGGARGSAANM